MCDELWVPLERDLLLFDCCLETAEYVLDHQLVGGSAAALPSRVLAPLPHGCRRRRAGDTICSVHLLVLSIVRD